MIGLILASVIALLGAAPSLRAEMRVERTSSCLVCHSKTQADYRDSVHARAGLSCVDCHGGNPNDMEETAMSPAAGFKGRPARARIPAFCATCHAKGDLMRPYGLPTDQYAEYQTSQHGQALARGDTRVAVCTDCHTTHHILPADNPLSSVSPMKLPQTCARCHADPARMSPYGLPTDQLEKFVKSVHGQALLAGQNKAAPNCATCHGSHGAQPPDVAHLHHVCGRCHSHTEEAFNASVHRAAVAEGRMSPCVSCHQHHAIQRPTTALLTSACAHCHEQDEPVRRLSQQLRSMIEGAQKALDQGQAAVRSALEGGLEVSEWQSRLEEAHTYLLQAAVTQHTLLPYRVERETRAVEEIARDAELAIQEIRERLHLRRLALLPIWGYILFTVGLLALKRRRAERERRREERPAA